MFTRALHWSLSWGRSIQSIPPQPISLRSILILSSHPRVFLVVTFHVAFPPKSYMHSSSPPSVLHAMPISSSLTRLYSPENRALHIYRSEILWYYIIDKFYSIVIVCKRNAGAKDLGVKPRPPWSVDSNGPVRFEVFTAVVLKSIIFWDMTQCSPLCSNRQRTTRRHIAEDATLQQACPTRRPWYTFLAP
jgi:hypothetical protein